ncbi:3309_t:CDS:2 [Rhizophagus irregularis]|nr:3309_t:CDS:2 [Rhizophagus irregularis]
MSMEEGSSKIFHQDYIDNEVTSKAEEEKPKVESPIDTIVIVNENEIEPLTNPQANVEQENVNNAKVENRKNLDGDETEPLLPKSNSKQVGYIEEIIFLLFTIPSWAGDVVSFLLALILVSFPGEYKDRTMEFLKDFFEADRWWKKLVLILTSKLKKNKKAKKELVKQDEQVKQDRQVKQDGNVEQVV